MLFCLYSIPNAAKGWGKQSYLARAGMNVTQSSHVFANNSYHCSASFFGFSLVQANCTPPPPNTLIGGVNKGTNNVPVVSATSNSKFS